MSSNRIKPQLFNIYQAQLAGLIPLMPLPSTHPLVQLFHIRTLNTLHQPSENELAMCDKLLGPDYFPNSLWVMSLRATVLYHLHGLFFASVYYKTLAQISHRLRAG